MQRIGVFVCHCGSNIAATVDVKKVVEMVSHEPGVVHAEDYQYMCSEVGQAKIIEAIREKHLTGLVVCSCSPRMHETTFRKTAERAGLNPYMVEIANIREHCSWIHKNMEEATEKAVILARAAIAKVNLDAPLFPGESRVTKRALVIGGGIAGIQTALDIADAGYEVDIVEKTPSIGGRMSQLDKTFPTLDCSACILTPKMVEASANEKIHLYTYSEVEKVSGFVGDFTVDIRKKARSVDMSKCTGCGVCQEKCPSRKTPSEFNRGLNTRSAIYTPFAQAIPNVPVIDREACIKFKTGKCGLCQKVCQAGKICIHIVFFNRPAGTFDAILCIRQDIHRTVIVFPDPPRDNPRNALMAVGKIHHQYFILLKITGLDHDLGFPNALLCHGFPADI